jgi:hypothetical protein
LSSAERVLKNIFDPIDRVGNFLFGNLWRVIYLTIQDAIAIGILLQIPNWIGQLIIGREFSSFSVCLAEDPFGIERYACYFIVTSKFTLWILLAGRIIGHIGRFLADFYSLKRRKETIENDSSKL